MNRLTRPASIAVALGLALAGCKKQPAVGAGTGTAVAVPPDAAPAPIDAAPAPPPDDEGNPSEAVVAAAMGAAPYYQAPALARDGSRIVWCTAANNGMASVSEVVCHFAPVGKGAAEMVVVMAYQDGLAIEEASYDDDSADPAAKARAEAARTRVLAAVAKVKARAEVDPAHFGASAERCATFDGNTDDDPADAIKIGVDGACTIGGATVTLSSKGVVTVTAGGTPLFSETFAPVGERPKSDDDLDCQLTANRVEAVLDPASPILALQVWRSNPSDGCALTTAYAIRAVKLR